MTIRPVEMRWWCRGCRTYVPDTCVREHHLAKVSALLAHQRGEEPRRLEREHGRYGRRGPLHCGPVVRVEVGDQEQLVEWLESVA